MLVSLVLLMHRTCIDLRNPTIGVVVVQDINQVVHEYHTNPTNQCRRG
jgi:hypothetical protein